MRKKYFISGVFFAMVANLHAEKISTSAEQTGLDVTIYNQNIALVKDKREMRLPEGDATLAFKDVSAQIMPETAILSANGVSLLEMNFEYDLLSPQTLLNKYIGKNVTLERYVDEKLIQENATVLANNNGTVLKVGDKIRTNNGINIVFDDVPKNLRDRPTLTMLVNNKTPEKQPVSLSYLTRGLQWRADYVASIRDDKTLDLKGWVTLTNNSGTTYKKAKLQVVAGTVNLASPLSQPRAPRMYKARVKKMSAPAPASMSEESLFEYHLYTLPRTTTIKNNQKKQVSLLQSSEIPYTKQMLINANELSGWTRWANAEEYQKLATEANIIIDNKKNNNLGVPMPAGVIRTYLKDSEGNAQFIGEDRIKHTPENEMIKLKLGEAFDVTAKRKQTDYSKKRHSKKTAISRVRKTDIITSYEVVFKNAKSKEVTVDYRERFAHQWEVKKQSIPSKKLNSTLNGWKVAIPAKGKTTLTFTVKMTY